MKKRVNITVDEELHEWAVKHFGEREFSKAISDQLICISSSVCKGVKRNMENSDDELILKSESYNEFKLLMELAQKYENLEDGEGYPLHMSEEELATMMRITKKTNLMDEELQRKKIQAKVEEILLPTKMALTKALFEIEKEVSSKFARIRL